MVLFIQDFGFVCRYMDELMRLKAAAREGGSDYLTWNDIQACVDQVNSTIQEEHESESRISYFHTSWSSYIISPDLLIRHVSGIAAIGLINEALHEGDPKKTLEALQHPAAKLTDVDPSVAQHYFDKLLETRREKAHVSTEWGQYTISVAQSFQKSYVNLHSTVSAGG